MCFGEAETLFVEFAILSIRACCQPGGEQSQELIKGAVMDVGAHTFEHD